MASQFKGRVHYTYIEPSTGASLHFVQGYDCHFVQGYDCHFVQGYDCHFVQGYDCHFALFHVNVTYRVLLTSTLPRRHGSFKTRECTLYKHW